MSIAYAGPPMALVRSENNSELATSLGVTIMQQGINELERLQQEQARLAKKEEKQRVEDEARLQAYYAQRDELLLRRRELKVQAEMQVVEADRLRRQIEAERAANAEINKAEIRQRLRELQHLAQASGAARRSATGRAAAAEAAVNTGESKSRRQAASRSARDRSRRSRSILRQAHPGAPVDHLGRRLAISGSTGTPREGRPSHDRRLLQQPHPHGARQVALAARLVDLGDERRGRDLARRAPPSAAPPRIPARATARCGGRRW